MKGSPKNRVLSFGAVGIAGLLASAVALVDIPGFNPFESQFVKACEAALKDTLMAPSTYKRIEITRLTEKITIDEYLVDESITEVALFIRSMHDWAFRSFALIKYDASNSYGTPLRGISRCTYDTTDGDDSSARDFTVKIDGKTSTDRLVDAIVKSR